MEDAVSFVRDAEWLTARRVRLAAVIFLFAVVAIFGASIVPYLRQGIVLPSGESLGRDFMNYWAAARLALHGHAASAYDLHYFSEYQRAIMAPDVSTRWYGYPPVTILLTLPLGMLSFVPAWALWLVVGAGLVAWVLAEEIGWTWAMVAAIASPAFLQNAIAGQNGAFTAALIGGGLLLLQPRPRLAGILLGLLCCKPHLAILVPVALAGARQWQAFLAAAMTVLILCAASAMLFGWHAWAAFFADMSIHRDLLENRFGMWPRMPSVYLMMRWLHVPNDAAYIGQGISAIAAAAVLFFLWRKPGEIKVKGAGLMVSAFLATPYAWDYDMVMLSIAAVWLWRDACRSGWRPWEKAGLALLIVAPAVTPVLAFWAHIQLGPVILWLVLGLIVQRAYSAERESRRLALGTA